MSATIVIHSAVSPEIYAKLRVTAAQRGTTERELVRQMIGQASAG